MDNETLNKTILLMLSICNKNTLDDFGSNQMIINGIKTCFVSKMDNTKPESLNEVCSKYTEWLKNNTESDSIVWRKFWDFENTYDCLKLSDSYKSFLQQLLHAENSTRHDQDLKPWISSFKDRLTMMKYIMRTEQYDVFCLELLETRLIKLGLEDVASEYIELYSSLGVLDKSCNQAEAIAHMYISESSLSKHAVFSLVQTFSELKHCVDMVKVSILNHKQNIVPQLFDDSSFQEIEFDV